MHFDVFDCLIFEVNLYVTNSLLKTSLCSKMRANRAVFSKVRRLLFISDRESAHEYLKKAS